MSQRSVLAWLCSFGVLTIYQTKKFTHINMYRTVVQATGQFRGSVVTPSLHKIRLSTNQQPPGLP